MVIIAKLSRQKGQSTVRQYACRILEHNVHQIHIELSGRQRFFDESVVGCLVRLDKHDMRAEHPFSCRHIGFVQPVCLGDSHAGPGRLKERVHIVQYLAVRVEYHDSLVLGKVEGMKLVETVGPRCARFRFGDPDVVEWPQNDSGMVGTNAANCFCLRLLPFRP